MLLITIAIAVLLALAGAMQLSSSYIPGPIDEGLRMESSITKTATYNGTAFDQGSGYAPGGPGQACAAVIKVSARDTADANETYTFKVQESADNSTWTDASPAITCSATGVMAVPAFISQRYQRLTATLGGTTPSITYEAWLVPYQNAI